MKNVLETVLNWFHIDESRELEAYLARAANAADVDRLLRQWENKDKSSYFHRAGLIFHRAQSSPPFPE